MSRKQTSKQSDCDHISRVKEWGFNEDHNFVAVLWDCTRCGVESSTPFSEVEKEEIDHSKCDYSPCFGCKAKGLQLNTGDAGRDLPDKKLQSGLASYRDARRQGVQPNGTHPIQVQAAMAASEKLGKAYQGDTMVRADKITKSLAKTINEVGA